MVLQIFKISLFKISHKTRSSRSETYNEYFLHFSDPPFILIVFYL
jgi:hypothetical protein